MKATASPRSARVIDSRRRSARTRAMSCMSTIWAARGRPHDHRLYCETSRASQHVYRVLPSGCRRGQEGLRFKRLPGTPRSASGFRVVKTCPPSARRAHAVGRAHPPALVARANKRTGDPAFHARDRVHQVHVRRLSGNVVVAARRRGQRESPSGSRSNLADRETMAEPRRPSNGFARCREAVRTLGPPRCRRWCRSRSSHTRVVRAIGAALRPR